MFSDVGSTDSTQKNVLQIIIFAAPTPEVIWKAVDGFKLLSC